MVVAVGSDSVGAVPALEVTRLAVHHGDLVAVDDVSFSVEAGEIVTLLGPNGAGKTSTIETIEGLRRPTSGTVRVLGVDPVADRATVTAQMGVMLQEGGVYPGIRAREILTLYAGFFTAPRDVDDLLDLVGLARRAGSAWRQLSGGEQQRLSLALALVGRPRVALLDEPSAGVDVTGRQLVRDVIRTLATEGTAVLVTTHDLDEAEKLADRIVILHEGSLVATGTPQELLASSPTPEIRFAAPPGIDTVALGGAIDAVVSEVRPGEYLVAAEPSPAVIARITAWLAERDLTLGDLRAGRQRLEDVFLALTEASDATPIPEAHGNRRGRRRSRTGSRG